MRELKFRAWDKKDGKWLFGYEYPNLGGFSLIGEVVLLGELNSIPIERWNDVAIMQFTGLLDRHGKEIYEGDIVRLKYSSNTIGVTQGEVIEQVKFYQDQAWGLGDIENGGPDGSATVEFIEVIGNVYEHPHLLEKAS